MGRLTTDPAIWIRVAIRSVAIRPKIAIDVFPILVHDGDDDGEDEKPIFRGMIYEHLSAKIVLSRARRRALHRRHSSLAKARFGSVDYYPFPFSPLPLSPIIRVNCDYAGGADIYGAGALRLQRRTENLRPVFVSRYHLTAVLKEIAMIPNSKDYY